MAAEKITTVKAAAKAIADKKKEIAELKRLTVTRKMEVLIDTWNDLRDRIAVLQPPPEEAKVEERMKELREKLIRVKWVVK